MRLRLVILASSALLSSACFEGEFLDGLECARSNQCAPSYVCVFPSFTEIADGADPDVGRCGHPQEPEIPEPSFLAGSLRAFGDNPDLVGVAMLVRQYDGTRASIQISGLMPGTEYPAHVHTQRCDDSSGGDEYKLDPRIDNVDESNELWLSLTTDDNGSGLSSVSKDHIARVDARSVVVHGPEGDDVRVACANLAQTDPPDRFSSGGSLVTVLPPATDMGLTAITGSTSLERSLDEGTTLSIEVAGLDPLTTYVAIAHDARCSVAGGGLAYRINRNIGDRRASNELRLEFETDAAGTGSSEVNFADHIARADAQSMVVHVDPLGPGWACIDLVPFL